MKVFIRCTALFVTAILIIYGLWFWADKPNDQPNNFQRHFFPTAVKNVQIHELDKQIRNLAGATPYNLFFSTNDPEEVLRTDISFNNKKSIRYKIPDQLKDSIGHHFLADLDSPYVFYYAYNIPAVLRYKLGTNDANIFYKPGSAFTRVIALSEDEFVFRQLDLKSKDQIFSVWNTTEQKMVTKASILPTFSDGGLSTDGMLNFDKQDSLLVYVSAYNNQLFVFDSALHIIHKSKTIDTFSQFQLKVKNINNHFTNVSPTKIINGASYIFRGKLYVNSMLMADNEESTKFMKNAVIDVYDLKKGSYLGSFYIPRVNKEKISKIIATDNNLFLAFYRNSLVTCEIAL